MPFRGAIVLAAGKGTRMKSRLPKVLHKVGGKHMVEHVINAVREMGVQDVIVVIGHEAEMVREALGGTVNFAVQEQQLGTGHAVIIALPFIKENEGSVLIVCGDTPLIQADTLKKLWDAHLSSQTACTILSAELPDPTGYGRIIRNHDHTVAKVVEQKDAQPQELSVNEINTGTYCFDLKNLREVVKDLTQNNRQGEYYLTDAVALLVSRGLTVNAMVAEDPYETIGINSRSQLAEAEKVLRLRKINALMEEGVTIVDPDSTFIDQNVQIGEDTVIEPFTFLRGNTIIGSGCTVGPDTDIKDSSLGNRVTVTRTVMIESSIADGCIIGPFAYLRPGTKLEQNVKVGDFVEIKKSVIGPQSKVPHLSYIGSWISC